jgi:hypothetical protein
MYNVTRGLYLGFGGICRFAALFATAPKQLCWQSYPPPASPHNCKCKQSPMQGAKGLRGKVAKPLCYKGAMLTTAFVNVQSLYRGKAAGVGLRLPQSPPQLCMHGGLLPARGVGKGGCTWGRPVHGGLAYAMARGYARGYVICKYFVHTIWQTLVHRPAAGAQKSGTSFGISTESLQTYVSIRSTLDIFSNFLIHPIPKLFI